MRGFAFMASRVLPATVQAVYTWFQSAMEPYWLIVVIYKNVLTPKRRKVITLEVFKSISIYYDYIRNRVAYDLLTTETFRRKIVLNAHTHYNI
jgi:hypothetical protein